MKSRRERHKRKKLPFKKILIGAVLLIGVVGSSVTITFADQDIESLLTNWFDNTKDEALQDLEEAVSKEQKEQTKRLKEELQSEVEAAEKQLNQFTEEQKEKILKELQRYTDQLIDSIEITNEEKEKEIETKLYYIFEEAKEKMNTILLEEKQQKQKAEQAEEFTENETIETENKDDIEGNDKVDEESKTGKDKEEK
ncbi:MAG TPA: hypothetical protein VK072_04440 [Candidatus Avamphibacillus sp.]|nr:hypothetical protein [Candidatus Avamphibacillus sp.]